MAKKYECEDCKRKFLYAATKTITIETDGEFESTEYRCCPYCGSMDFDENVIEESVIVSVKSVNLDEVDDWLSKGYTVQSLYAKNAVLIKKESPETIDCGITTLEAAEE